MAKVNQEWLQRLKDKASREEPFGCRKSGPKRIVGRRGIVETRFLPGWKLRSLPFSGGFTLTNQLSFCILTVIRFLGVFQTDADDGAATLPAINAADSTCRRNRGAAGR